MCSVCVKIVGCNPRVFAKAMFSILDLTKSISYVMCSNVCNLSLYQISQLVLNIKQKENFHTSAIILYILQRLTYKSCVVLGSLLPYFTTGPKFSVTPTLQVLRSAIFLLLIAGI